MFDKIRINYGISYGCGMFDGSQIKQDVIDAADKSTYEYKKKNRTDILYDEEKKLTHTILEDVK